jgi:hypothetical protein
MGAPMVSHAAHTKISAMTVRVQIFASLDVACVFIDLFFNRSGAYWGLDALL